MNTKENLSGGEEVNDGASQWDDVEFPEFSPEGESENKEQGAEEETVDIDQLAQDLIAARKDAKEGATWDKEQRAYIGADGLPRDWAHLVGYLKKNPDAIKTATETLQSLQTPEASADGAVKENAAEASPVETATETEENVAEESTAEESSTEAETELDKQSQDIIKYYEKRAQEGGGFPDLVLQHYHKNQDVIMSKMSQKVQDACALGDARRKLNAVQNEVNSAQSKLEELPRLTLPWSKNGREKRELRKAIKEKEKKIDSLFDSISGYEEEFKNNPLNDKEKATVDAIESIPKLILQGAEVQKQKLQNRLDLISKVEQQLELPEDKRDWSLIEQIQPWAKGHSEEHIRETIRKERENAASYLKEVEEGYKPLEQEQKAA